MRNHKGGDIIATDRGVSLTNHQGEYVVWDVTPGGETSNGQSFGSDRDSAIDDYLERLQPRIPSQRTIHDLLNAA